MPKNEEEATYWMLDDQIPDEQEYDLAQDDRKLLTGLEYVDNMEDAFAARYQDKLEEVTFEELKMDFQDQEYTALRVYDGEDLVAADFYQGDGKSRENTEVNFIESVSPEWADIETSALSILNRYSPPDTGETENVKEKEESREQETVPGLDI